MICSSNLLQIAQCIALSVQFFLDLQIYSVLELKVLIPSNDIQIISPPTRAPSLPSTRSFISILLVQISSSYITSSVSSLTSKVRAQKLAKTKQDDANNKDILPTSLFSLDLKGKLNNNGQQSCLLLRRAYHLLKCLVPLREMPRHAWGMKSSRHAESASS